MPETTEPVEVQIYRVRWDGLNKLASTISTVLLAIVVAVQTYYQAQMSARLERVAVQSEENGRKVDAVGAETRSTRIAVGAPPPKE